MKRKIFGFLLTNCAATFTTSSLIPPSEIRIVCPFCSSEPSNQSEDIFFVEGDRANLKDIVVELRFPTPICESLVDETATINCGRNDAILDNLQVIMEPVVKSGDSESGNRIVESFQVNDFTSPHVRYRFSTNTLLEADSRYVISVQTLDENFSLSTYIHTTLLTQMWEEAEWIGGGTLLYSSFTTEKNSIISSSTVYISGVGCFSVLLNGVKPSGNSRLDPGFSTIPSATLPYRAMDVTGLLVENGTKNEILISLGMCKYGYLGSDGEGMFCDGAHGSTSTCRGAIMVLSTTYQDGSMINITTSSDGTWYATTEYNPIQYTHLFHGEVYDSRIGDSLSNINTSNWQVAGAYDTTSNQQRGIGELTLHAMPPIGVSHRWAAQSVTILQSSKEAQRINNEVSMGALSYSYLFDFGHNLAGVVELNFTALGYRLSSGASLILRHAEILNTDGTLQNTYCGYPCIESVSCLSDGGNCANQTDVYITNGLEADIGSTSTWSPLHTYHGFRYVLLEGLVLPGEETAPPLDFINALAVNSLVDTIGEVSFPDYEILNTIQTGIVRTQIANLHSIPTDCPQREKRGWLGDAQWSSPEAIMNFDMLSLYTNFLSTIKISQVVVGCTNPNGVDEGSDPTIRPETYTCCNETNPSFGCSDTGTNFTELYGAIADVIPYEKIPYGGIPGDPNWENAVVVIPWELYMRTGDLTAARSIYTTAKSFVDFLTNHIDPNVGLIQFGYYGDWLAIESTPSPLVCSWGHLLAIDRLVDLAIALGYTADVNYYSDLLLSLKAIWHETYWDESISSYGNSQTANILPLYLQIPPNETFAQGALDTLLLDIEQHENSLTTGALGSRYAFEVLMSYGAHDVALSVASKTDQPSIGYMLASADMPGTVWENWDGDSTTADGSKNHPMFCGGIGLWLYQLAGVVFPSQISLIQDEAQLKEVYSIHNNNDDGGAPKLPENTWYTNIPPSASQKSSFLFPHHKRLPTFRLPTNLESIATSLKSASVSHQSISFSWEAIQHISSKPSSNHIKLYWYINLTVPLGSTAQLIIPLQQGPSQVSVKHKNQSTSLMDSLMDSFKLYDSVIESDVECCHYINAQTDGKRCVFEDSSPEHAQLGWKSCHLSGNEIWAVFSTGRFELSFEHYF